MSISLSFSTDDKKQVKENHNPSVLPRLENKIETKNDTLKWKSTVEECFDRFYSTIHKNNQIFPIISFRVDKCAYRAVFCWIAEHNTFEFIRVVGKQDHYPNSNQRDVSENLIKHPHKIASQAKHSFEQKQGTNTSTS